MPPRRFVRSLLYSVELGLVALALACGGKPGSNSSLSMSAASSGSTTPGRLMLSVSDASTEDWAFIGVKLLNIYLRTQDGSAVTVFTAPATPAVLNLVQLDSISDLLGTAQVPPGAYTGVTLVISANPGDVSLTAAANPSAGFDGVANEVVPANDIQIQGAALMGGNLAVAVNLTLATPLVVTAGATSNLDLEFVLAHPAFLVDHPQTNGADTLWTVNFNGTVRQNPVSNPEVMVLRHAYGTVTAVASGNAAVTLTRDFPTQPLLSPETATPTLQILTVTADPTNGTIFHDLDAKTTSVIQDFSTVGAGLVGRNIRTATRFQADGTLVAVRMWASSVFSNVWAGPEGHVDHVTLGSATSPYTIHVQNESGAPSPIVINNGTKFFLRSPTNAQADATALATGTGFLDAMNLVRGFKVHVSPVDATATPLVADSVDIETAAFAGYLSAATTSGFTVTRSFARSSDDYTASLGFAPATTLNGTGGSSAAGTVGAVQGYTWWDLTLPGLASTSALQVFTNAVSGSAQFGGTAGSMNVWGYSAALPTGAASGPYWAARFTILEPMKLPEGTVVSPLATSSSGASFSMTVAGGDRTPLVVNLTTIAGSATLVYQEDLPSGSTIYTLSPIDLTTTAGVTTLAARIIAGAKVIVYGIPNADGSITASALYYSTTGAS